MAPSRFPVGAGADRACRGWRDRRLTVPEVAPTCQAGNGIDFCPCVTPIAPVARHFPVRPNSGATRRLSDEKPALDRKNPGLLT